MSGHLRALLGASLEKSKTTGPKKAPHKRPRCYQDHRRRNLDAVNEPAV
jgi:hypothetical protein